MRLVFHFRLVAYDEGVDRNCTGSESLPWQSRPLWRCGTAV